MSGWLGTRPFLTLELAFDALVKKYEAAAQHRKIKLSDVKTVKTGLKRSKDHAEKVLQSYLNQGVESFSKLAQTRRALITATNTNLLPVAGITSFISDLHISAAQLSRISKDSYPKVLSTLLWDRFKHMGSKDLREQVARRANMILMGDVLDYSRRLHGGGVSGMAHWYGQKTMFFTGIPWISDAGTTSNAFYTAMAFGDAFKLGLDGLDDKLSTILKTHGITDESWNLVRSMPDVIQSVEGVDMVFPDRIYSGLRQMVEDKKITDRRANEIYRSFDTYFNAHAREKSIPTPNTYDNAFFQVEKDNPESVVNNVGAFMRQYMPIAMTSAKYIRDAGQGKRLGVKADMFHASMAKMMLLSTLSGAAIVILGDIAKGRSPRDVNQGQFWLDSMMRGGALGLYGDFILGENNSYFGGFASSVLGPVISGPLYHSIQMTRNVLSLEGGKAWDDLWRVINTLTPRVLPPAHPLLINTLFLHSLGDLNGNERSKQAIRNRLEKQGSGYFAD